MSSVRGEISSVKGEMSGIKYDWGINTFNLCFVSDFQISLIDILQQLKYAVRLGVKYK